jgi:hypothetical protein
MERLVERSRAKILFSDFTLRPDVRECCSGKADFQNDPQQFPAVTAICEPVSKDKQASLLHSLKHGLGIASTDKGIQLD